ncbi:unnamed protein product (macronuclear) [Paramecium tetraurelia]|uniref:Uncharacterized protein n=1 Tax=Paramecium tetraurelia TaxID=5888 RepID=A0CIW7_PARTE|nr:uncharacterized protein GSPATT00007869001 [Paramecium tetraurelia]CAK70734.1 unnamed protein product [Paramecium tetraurelia]|eukprot:XP_001438131.1 hypothetical protein (macronuclear) [Paramecium tetraurelia strain d4-2]
MSIINQELLQKAIQLINSQPSIYQQLNTTELDKGIDLIDIYSVYGDVDQNIYEEPGEIQFNFEMEQEQPYEEVKESIPPQNLKKSQITLDYIKNYDKCDQVYRTIAETQGELEVFLDRNQDIYRSFKIWSDQLNYGELYSKDPKYIEKIKFTLILLSEWLIAVCYKSQVKKRILIQTQTQPRVQYKANIFLEYIYEPKKSNESRRTSEVRRQTVHEILLAATPDMAYVLSEGFIIQKLTNQLIAPIQGGYCKIKDWLIAVRGVTNLNMKEFQELLKISREYFSEQSTI